MTKFSWEVPTKHLRDFDPYQDYYLVLSFLYKDPNFATFMMKTSKAIILDNSYNELREPGDPKTLYDLALRLNPRWVICPDCHGWSLEELQHSYRSMERLIHPENLLIVVKNEEQYLWAMDEGIPFCTTYDERMDLPDIINFKATHFLGLIMPSEVRHFHPISCDTGMPIKLALEGKTIGQWIEEGYPHPLTKPEYFDLTLTDKEIDLAIKNIEEIKKVSTPVIGGRNGF